MSDVAAVTGALHFAALKHRTQRRKDGARTPYVNHVIAVVDTLSSIGRITDPVVLMAAALHDTVEDTDTSWTELTDRFGRDVCDVVREVTDDKTLPKEERKRLQVEHASHLSDRAKQLKLADKACNVRDVVDHPPHDWSVQRRVAYLDWTEAAAEGCRGVNAALEENCDRELRRGRESLAPQP